MKMGDDGIDLQLTRAMSVAARKRPLPWESSRLPPTFLEAMGRPKQVPRVLPQIDFKATLGFKDAIIGVVSLKDNTQSSVSCLKPSLPLPVRRVKLMAWKAEPDNLRRQALNRVRLMLESDLSVTRLGKVIYELAEDLNNEDLIRQTLHDSFAGKAAATLYKRANALWRYFQQEGSGNYRAALHLTEDKVYRHVCLLRKEAGATAATQFLEALNFFDAALGFEACPAAELLSPRVRGAAHEAHTQKRQRYQARPLTSKEVLCLEALLLESSDVFTIVISGFILFCIVNCARWSDAQNATGLQVDASGVRAVMEAGTCRHKTARSAEQKVTLLPFVGFCCLLQHKEWGTKWVKVLAEVHKQMPNLPFLLPAWSEKEGKWLPRRMTFGEGSLYLRELLDMKRVSDEAAELPSTHSLKTTMLSWICKYGKFEIIERLILGHHLDRPSTSALTYGRANFTEPLRKVHAMLKEMVERKFLPDARPSILITSEILQAEASSEEMYREMQGAAEPEAEGSASEVDDDEDHELQSEELVPPIDRRCVALPNREKYAQHVMSGTLHIIVDASKFACGRPRTQNYTVPAADSVHGAPLCDQCRSVAG